MSKSVKTLLKLTACVAVVALTATGAGGATASAREPELITVNTAMPLNNNPDPKPVYPEANRTFVRGIVEDSNTVTCNSKMVTITVAKNGTFTLNGQLVSTKLASNGVGITSHTNRPLTIIVSSNGIKVAEVPAGSAAGSKFVLRNEDWTGDRKFVYRDGGWVESYNFPLITFCVYPVG